MDGGNHLRQTLGRRGGRGASMNGVISGITALPGIKGDGGMAAVKHRAQPKGADAARGEGGRMHGSCLRRCIDATTRRQTLGVGGS